MPRYWTLQEANAALPRVEEMFVECRALLSELKSFRDQIDDLRILWGDRIHDRACADHKEFRGYLMRFQETQGRLRDAVARFHDQGIHLKDLDMGLVDFASLRGNEEVFLCYRSGEGRVGHWHPLQGGYQTRRPVPPDLEETGVA